MKEEIPGQGRSPKQYSDSMKIIVLAVVTFLLSLIFFSCTKEPNCTVTRVITINEVRIDSTYVEREYIVQLECL
jgi:hypothetical protein